MDEAAFKRAFKAAKEIDKIDQEIKDLSEFASEIASGETDHIAFSLGFSRKKKPKSDIDGSDGRLYFRFQKINPFSNEPDFGHQKSEREATTYSRDITDTMALTLVGNIISELNTRRNRLIQQMEALGVTFK